jgi:hypothetical protein
MHTNFDFGWAIPIILLLLALFLLRDPEQRQSLKEFMQRSDQPINFAQMTKRTRVILITSAALLAAGIFFTAGIYFTKSLNPGSEPGGTATVTAIVTRDQTGSGAGTQTGASSPSAITVTDTPISSGPAITVPGSTATQSSLPIETPTEFTLPTAEGFGTPRPGSPLQPTPTP